MLHSFAYRVELFVDIDDNVASADLLLAGREIGEALDLGLPADLYPCDDNGDEYHVFVAATKVKVA